jgi:hypothetical protein
LVVPYTVLRFRLPASVVAPSQEEASVKLILPLKFNISPAPDGLSYRLATLASDDADRLLAPFDHLGPEDRARLAEQLFQVTWLGRVTTDPDSLFAAAGRSAREENKVAKCAEWMETFLKTHAYPSEEILAAAKAEGFTLDNVKEAKARLKGKGLRNSNRGHFQGGWWSGFGEPDSWVLRPKSPDTPESLHYGDIDPATLPHPAILHAPDRP